MNTNFICAINRMAVTTGKYALCEAALGGYLVCTEANDVQHDSRPMTISRKLDLLHELITAVDPAKHAWPTFSNKNTDLISNRVMLTPECRAREFHTGAIGRIIGEISIAAQYGQDIALIGPFTENQIPAWKIYLDLINRSGFHAVICDRPQEITLPYGYGSKAYQSGFDRKVIKVDLSGEINDMRA